MVRALTPSRILVRLRVAVFAAVLALCGLGLSADPALAACTSTVLVPGLLATFTCDGSNETITIDQSSSVLRHNRASAGDPGFRTILTGRLAMVRRSVR